MGRGNYTKPLAGAQIDWTHPLARNLKGAWLFNNTLKDYAQKNPPLTTPVVFAAGNSLNWYNPGNFGGNAITLDRASNHYFSTPSNAALQSGAVDLTVIVLINLKSKPADNGYVVSKDDGEYSIGYQNLGGQDRFIFFTTSATILQATTFGAPSINAWYFLVGGYNSVTGKSFISVNNGKQDTVTSAAPVASNNPLNVGRFSSTAGRYFDGRVEYVYFFKSAPGGGGALSSAEIGFLYTNPFAMFQSSPIRRTYFLMSQLGGFRGIQTGGLIGKRGIQTGGRV